MRSFSLTLWLFLIGATCFAQRMIHYDVSFPNAVHREAEISVTFAGLGQRPLEARMSRSSPGRYVLHEFAKNVYNVRASDGKGKPLTVTKAEPSQWTVAGHDGTVTLKYTLYGDHADGTYAGIDITHAHLNMPATFMWAQGMEDVSITVAFRPPLDSTWRIASQLFPTHHPLMFSAPNLQYLMDSPVELSNFALREWKVESSSTSSNIRLAIHHDGTEQEVDAFANMAKVVVHEVMGVFGELPSFDTGEYTFIADYLPYVKPDGMEHRNSTIVVATRPLKSGALENLGTVSHEFFHAWNVERLRPKSLEPFNFEQANMSGELWFAEGFTSYYAELVLARAELVSIDRYAERLSQLLDGFLNSKGRSYFSAVEMSEQAPFVDAATSVDATNRANTFISYYGFGEAIALGVDLTLRTRFPNLTLDDLMRRMWQQFGKPEKPFTNEDVRRELGALAQDQTFADNFFNRYVFGREVVDYKDLLARAGFALQKSKPNRAFLGFVRLNYDSGRAIVNSSTIVGSPLYRAGIDRGDRIVSIDTFKIGSSKDWDDMIAAQKPGDKRMIEFEQRGSKKKVSIVFDEHPRLEVVPFEQAGWALSDSVLNLRKQWLASRSPVQHRALVKYCPKCNRSLPFKTEYCPFDGKALGFTPSKTEESD